MEANTPNRDPFAALMTAPNYRRRKVINRASEVVATLASLLAVAVLALIIITVVAKGASAISIDFLTKDPAQFGQPGGGIAPAIVGTLLLVAIASAIAIPIGILIGVHTSEFASARVANVIRFTLDLLAGVPTVVTGVFIFGLLVVSNGQSGWAAAIALAIVMVPIVARSAQEVLALVPQSLREAGLALGLKRWRIVLRIVLPTALGGLITGAVLGIARVAGETAPLLFTSSIVANTVTTDPGQALPNIPVTIFSLSESAAPEDHARAWAAALLLILLVLTLSVVARAFHERSRRRMSG